MRRRVFVVGDGEAAKRFMEFCKQSNLDAVKVESYRIEELEPDSDSVIVDMSSEDDGVKFRILEHVGRKKRSGMLVLSRILTVSATKAASVGHQYENLVGFCVPERIDRKFVEIVRGEKTPDSIIEEAKEFFGTLSFEIVITKDHPGLILNRVLVSMINEAIFVHMFDLAKMEDIDEMMKLGANFPMGPFEYADELGLDNVLGILERLTQELGPHYRPCPLLRRKVEAGLLGKRVGEGFYKYQERS